MTSTKSLKVDSMPSCEEHNRVFECYDKELQW